MHSEEQQVLNQFIRTTGLKETAQRRAILDEFLRTERHVTIEDIRDMVNLRGGRIGYATVYRAMKLFADCGLAREVKFSDGVTRFEHGYKHSHHHHLVCTSCGAVIEFASQDMDKAEQAILKKHGFQMDAHRYEIFGLCNNCKGTRQDS